MMGELLIIISAAALLYCVAELVERKYRGTFSIMKWGFTIALGLIVTFMILSFGLKIGAWPALAAVAFAVAIFWLRPNRWMTLQGSSCSGMNRVTVLKAVVACEFSVFLGGALAYSDVLGKEVITVAYLEGGRNVCAFLCVVMIAVFIAVFVVEKRDKKG